MSLPSVRSISISTGTILRTILILVGLGVLWMIRDILLYIFIAILFAGVMYPWARWASQKKIPRGLAVVLFYLFLFGIVILVFSLLIPAILEQSKNLIDTFGGSTSWMSDAVSALKAFSDQHGLRPDFSSTAVGSAAQIQQAFGGAVNLITSIFGGLAGFFIVLVLSFYIIVEDSAIRDLFKNVIPVEHQEFISQIAWQIIDKLGAWLRGQLVLGLIIGVLYFIGFSILGVPYALFLAIFGGLLEFIPYAGPFISAVPALFLAFSYSPMRALVTLIVIIFIQQLENNVIVPKVMQKAVGLNPIVSIIAFMVGAKLFGIVGAIFAIPVATAISVASVEVIRWRRRNGA